MADQQSDAGRQYTRRLRKAQQLRVSIYIYGIFLYSLVGVKPLSAIALSWLPGSFYLQLAFVVLPLGIINAVSVLVFFFLLLRIDRQFGRSKATWGVTLQNVSKASLLGYVYQCAILEIMFASNRFFPSWGWLVAACLCTLLLLVTGSIVPWLLSFFYPVSELQPGPLDETLKRLAARAGLRVSSILEWRISETKRVANAVVTGVGPLRRILLTDTLARELSTQEVEAIIAHEFGHYAHHHLEKRLFLRWILYCPVLWILNAFVVYGLLPFVGSNLGWSNLNLVPGVFLAWWTCLACSQLLLAQVYRRQEKTADLYSWKLIGSTQPFVSAMRKIQATNLITIDRESQWKYSHPPTEDRILAAEQFQAQNSSRAIAAN